MNGVSRSFEVETFVYHDHDFSDSDFIKYEGLIGISPCPKHLDTRYSFIHKLINFDRLRDNPTQPEIEISNLDWTINEEICSLPKGNGGVLTINGGVWAKTFNLTNSYQYKFNLSKEYED